jgi:polysaccharide biosynthesis/export protein
MTSSAWRSLSATALAVLLAISTSYLFAQAEPKTVQPVSGVEVQSTGAPTGSVPAHTDQAQSISASEILIGSGDLLEIRVFGVQDLTQEVRVSGSGDITVPLIGTVHIAGLSQQQAEDFLAARFRDGGFLKDPHVSVFTKEYATQGVSVLGEVSKPGVYPLLGVRRLFDVISMAGGLTDRAGRLVTITHRDDPANGVNIEISSDPAKAAVSNLPIEPGDTILVSRAGVVYVVGDVARPAGFVMDNNGKMTVLQAIALAGGTNSTASLDSSKIIRKTPAGVQEIPMHLKKILSAKTDDIPLQADDVLFVPRSVTKGAAKRSAEAILQVATGLAIYGRL